MQQRARPFSFRNSPGRAWVIYRDIFWRWRWRCHCHGCASSRDRPRRTRLLSGKRQHLNRVRSNQTACAESCVQLPSLIASCDPYKPIDKVLSFRPSHLRFHFLPSRKRMLTVFSFFLPPFFLTFGFDLLPPASIELLFCHTIYISARILSHQCIRILYLHVRFTLASLLHA